MARNQNVILFEFQLNISLFVYTIETKKVQNI